MLEGETLYFDTMSNGTGVEYSYNPGGLEGWGGRRDGPATGQGWHWPRLLLMAQDEPVGRALECESVTTGLACTKAWAPARGWPLATQLLPTWEISSNGHGRCV